MAACMALFSNTGATKASRQSFSPPLPSFQLLQKQAAGLVTVAHNSGGPKADIVVPFQGAPTGFLAATEGEYAHAFARVFAMDEATELTPLRASARASIGRFSDEVFLRESSQLIGPFLGLRVFDGRES